MLEKAAAGKSPAVEAPADNGWGGKESGGTWRKFTNIDMCFQGDAEIIHDWKRHHTIASLKKIVEQKGYSAVCVGSFGHAALKSFDYQLTKEHCKPSQGYTNEIHIWHPRGERAKPAMAEDLSGGHAEAPSGVTHLKPGQRLTWAASQTYAKEQGGRLLTLAEARATMKGRALYPGEDQWAA